MVVFRCFAQRQNGRRRSRVSLLNGMSEFMGKQSLSGSRVRIVFAGIEDNMLTDGICMGIDGARRFGCLRIGVYPDRAEVLAEARLHECARAGIERPARRIQDAVDDWRRRRRTRSGGAETLEFCGSRGIGDGGFLFARIAAAAAG